MPRRRKIPLALLILLLLAWGAVTLYVLFRDRQEIGGLAGQEAPEDADTLELPEPVDRDLPEIAESGHLTMLTTTHASRSGRSTPTRWSTSASFGDWSRSPTWPTSWSATATTSAPSGIPGRRRWGG